MVGNYWLATEQINKSFDQASEDRDIALSREQQRYWITKQRGMEDLTTYNKKAVIWAEQNKQAAIDKFNASGRFWVYGGTVETLNQANATRKTRNLNPAIPTMGWIPNLINNPY